MAGGPGFNAASRGNKGSIERLGERVEFVSMLMEVHIRQHRPRVARLRRLIHGPLENLSYHHMLFRGHSLDIPEGANGRFMRCELVGFLVANQLTHAVRQYPVVIGNGGDRSEERRVGKE